MRLVTLVENLVYKPGLGAEHGFSLLIQTNDSTILFDTGQSGLILENAKALDVNLAAVDSLVLSHGHFDHIGGVDAFCGINKAAPIYIGEGFFADRYADKTNLYIGTGPDPKYKDRCVLVRGKKEIAPSVFIVSSIPIQNPFDTHFEGLSIVRDGVRREDDVGEEQYLCIVDRGGLIVISGCSHRGITNIIHQARQEFGLPIRLVLGGFHTKDASKEKTDAIVATLGASGIKAMGVCHCTGVEKLPALQKACGDGVFYNCTGTVITDDFFK